MLDKEDKKLTLGERELAWGSIISFKLTKEATYTSKEAKNGHSDQKFSTKEIENTDLFFLGIENDRIKTMLAEPFGKFYLEGKEGYENGPKELDNISKAMFEGQRGVVSARSLTVEDRKEAIKEASKVKPESKYRNRDGKDVFYDYQLAEVMEEAFYEETCEEAFRVFCWLGSQYHRMMRMDCTIFGLHYMNCGSVGNCDLYDSYGNYNPRGYGVRPVVYLSIEELTSEEELTQNETSTLEEEEEFSENKMQILECVKRIEKLQKEIQEYSEKTKELQEDLNKEMQKIKQLSNSKRP